MFVCSNEISIARETPDSLVRAPETTFVNKLKHTTKGKELH